MAEIPRNLGFNPRPIADWVDMEFVVQEIDQEIRAAVLAAGLDAMANVHRSIADGAANIANIIRGGQKKGG